MTRNSFLWAVLALTLVAGGVSCERADDPPRPSVAGDTDGSPEGSVGSEEGTSNGNSAEGRRLLVVAGEKDLQLFSSKPNGSDTRRVTDLPRSGVGGFGAAWSWGQDLVAYGAFSGLKPLECEIRVARSDGTGERALAKHQGGCPLSLGFTPGDEAVYWVPPPGTGADRVMLSPVNGGRTRVMLRTPENTGVESIFRVDLSPDGKRFVAVAGYTRPDAPGVGWLFEVDRQSGRWRPVFPVEEIGGIFCASWSPSGRDIAFMVSSQDQSGLFDTTEGFSVYTVRPDGRLLSQIGYAKVPSCPSWSPDQASVVWVGNRYQSVVVNTIDTDARHPTKLDDPDATGIVYVTWTP